MSAPQYGPQPYYAPREGIAITTQYPVLAWLFATVKPKIFVNGYEMPVWGWGRAVLPLAPGQYHVHVHTPYFFPNRVGPADYTTVVNAGQVVELEYKAPLFTFSRGSLGPPPQRYNGLVPTIAIFGVLALFVIAVAVLLVATA
jgi:hypothetical protein